MVKLISKNCRLVNTHIHTEKHKDTGAEIYLLAEMNPFAKQYPRNIGKDDNIKVIMSRSNFMRHVDLSHFLFFGRKCQPEKRHKKRLNGNYGYRLMFKMIYDT